MGLLIINTKLKASTLIETLVGTAIIVILFVIATLSLNHVFGHVMKNNTLRIDNHIYKLQYLYEHQKIKLPYQEDIEEWEIQMQEEQIDNKKHIEIKARNKQTNKSQVVEYFYEIIES